MHFHKWSRFHCVTKIVGIRSFSKIKAMKKVLSPSSARVIAVKLEPNAARAESVKNAMGI